MVKVLVMRSSERLNDRVISYVLIVEEPQPGGGALYRIRGQLLDNATALMPSQGPFQSAGAAMAEAQAFARLHKLDYVFLQLGAYPGIE